MMYGAAKKPYIRLLIPSILIILCIILIVPLLGACGGTVSNTFLELLGLVPADYAVMYSGHQVYFILTDYNSLYQDTGIILTTLEELFEKIIADKFVKRVVGGSFITGYGPYAYSSSIRKEYVGYDATCIDAEIQFGYPPTDGVAAIGRFDPQATKDAFSHRDEWPSWAVDSYTTENYNGVTIHSWGSGLETHLETRLVPPHIDMLGRARPLAVTDKYLFYTAAVELLKMSIDASQNQHPSLADLPEYAAIANGLTDLQAYAAMVGNGDIANLCLSMLEAESYQLSETEIEILINSLGTPLKNFLTLGSGIGQDENGAYVAIVLYHENSDYALQNVSLLKQRIESEKSLGSGELWSEIIYDTDIKNEGNLLLAKLYTTSLGLWGYWWFDNDNLLFHEE